MRCACGAHAVRMRCACGARAVCNAVCVQSSKAAAHVLEHILAVFIAAEAELALNGAEVHGMLHDLRIVGKVVQHIVERLSKRCGSFHLQQLVHNTDWNRWADGGGGGSGRAAQPLRGWTLGLRLRAGLQAGLWCCALFPCRRHGTGGTRARAAAVKGRHELPRSPELNPSSCRDSPLPRRPKFRGGGHEPRNTRNYAKGPKV
eukprot:scaffold66327_cov58-Phaeocystis_antarctica.AAC.8